jgi:quercetin dioxygenase-like cupin family protein
MMSSVEMKSFETADEVRSLDKSTVEILTFGGGSVARFTFEPGWKWSEHVSPKMGTPTCQATHFGAVQSGHLHIVHEDGTSIDVGPGDSYTVAAGHDAWVIGDEPFVALEFEAAESYI